MSEGLHYFDFLYQRFLSSTLGWPEDAQMGYIKLLIVQFERGSIPDDIKEVGGISPAAKKHWKRLRPKFRGVREDGSIYNHVMEGIRNKAVANYNSSVENGRKGGRPKKPKNKPAGYGNNNPNETGGFSTGNRQGNPEPKLNERQPVTSNEVYTLKESKSVNTRADLSESNLFRKPNIPTVEEVSRVFAQQGGTPEMALKFFENNEATGWFYRGSAITSFSYLVPGYIANWNRNEKAAPSQSQEKRMVI